MICPHHVWILAGWVIVRREKVVMGCLPVLQIVVLIGVWLSTSQETLLKLRH